MTCVCLAQNTAAGRLIFFASDDSSVRIGTITWLTLSGDCSIEGGEEVQIGGVMPSLPIRLYVAVL